MNMGKDDERFQAIPPQIRVALSVLSHTRFITWQVDASIPVRDLTSLERSVEATALRAIQHYMLGEMDYAPSNDDAKPNNAAETAAPGAAANPASG
jgi:hypothetical protein